ncbi:MAG: hypothetical protein Q9219_006546 [cf. Caloplaca sp. 3 TL-2023]
MNSLRDRGLVSFTAVKDSLNGICLCKSCHATFYDRDDPAFMMVPKDLSCFVRWEENDHRRRLTQFRRSGEWSSRIPPTAADYLHYQKTTDAQCSSNSSGGLYHRIFLHDYLPPTVNLQIPLDSRFPPKPWHGCPLATLYRSFKALSGPRTSLLPPTLRTQLRQLQEMYDAHDQRPIDSTSLEAVGSARNSTSSSSDSQDRSTKTGQRSASSRAIQVPRHGPQQCKKTQSDAHEQGRSGEHYRSSGRTNRQIPGASEGVIRTYTALTRSHTHPAAKRPRKQWNWGPSATTEDKVTFFKQMRNLGGLEEGRGVQDRT